MNDFVATVLEEAARRVAQTSNMDLELRLVYAETVAAAFSPLVTTLVLTRDREARTYVIGEMLRFCYSILREIRAEWPQARRQIPPSDLPPLMQRALDMPSFQGRQGPIEEELRNIAFLALTNSLPPGSLCMTTNDPPTPGQTEEHQAVELEPEKFQSYELRASEFIDSAVQAKARRQVTLRLAGPAGAAVKEHAIFTVPFIDVLAGAHGSAVVTDPVNNPHQTSVSTRFLEATRDLSRRDLQLPLDGDGLYAWGGIPALMGENGLPIRDVTRIPSSYPPALEVQLTQEPPLVEPRAKAPECQGIWSWTGATSRGPAPAPQGAEAARPVAPSATGLPSAAANLLTTPGPRQWRVQSKPWLPFRQAIGRNSREWTRPGAARPSEIQQPSGGQYMESGGNHSQLPGPWRTAGTARSGVPQPRMPRPNSCSGRASLLKLHYPREPGALRALTPGPVCVAERPRRRRKPSRRPCTSVTITWTGKSRI